MVSDGKSGDVDVVVVGSVGLDSVQTVEEKRDELLGGSVSYACPSASFFAKTGMVGIVGTDFPAAGLRVYERFGVDLAGLQREPGRTFRWSGVYEDDMINRRTLRTELNVFEKFMPELPGSYSTAPYLLLGNISPGLQLHVLSQAVAPQFVVADTMDLWIDIAREELMDVIRRVDMVMMNDSEARLLTGLYNLRACAERIMSWGPRFVVVKKGEHGAMSFSEAGIFLAPAYPVAVVKDPTGAGDSFAGAFLGAFAKSGGMDDFSVRAALLYGSVVASFTVEDFSVERLLRLSAPEIEARMDELLAMTRFRVC